MAKSGAVKARSGLCVGVALAAVVPGVAQAQTVPTPTVAYPGTVVGTPILTQERGLNLPVPPVVNIAAVNAQEAAALVASRNAGFTPNARCGFVPPWVLSGTTVVFAPSNGFGALGLGSCYSSGSISPNNFLNTAFAERRVENILVSTLIDNTIGNPGTVTVRGIGNGLPVLTVNTADLANARRSLASMARTQSGRRHFVGTEVRTGGGPTVSSDRVLGQSLTGRDILVFLVDQIGDTPARQQNIVGTQINCPSSTSTIGCTGGVRVDSASDTITLNVHTISTLYITTSVERTINGGTTFFDAALTQLPIGAVHAAAQSAGFEVVDRFLGRLARSDFGLGGGKRAHVWGEAWTGRTRFDANGDAGRTSVDGHGFLLGAAFAASDALTLGVAGEWGRSDMTIASGITPESGRADHLKGGVHARLSKGRFSANAAAMIGRFDVDSAGASALGTASARYGGTIKGGSIEAGYDLAVGGAEGALTLRPQLGFAVLGWSRPGFSETGGPAPLSVAQSSAQQTRLWGGLLARGGTGPVTLEAYGRLASIGGDRVARITSFDPQLPGVPFAVTGPDHGKTVGEYSVTLGVKLGPNAHASIGYEGSASGGFTGHALRGGVLVRF